MHHCVGENFDFRVIVGVAADQGRNHFGEVQHPERQAEIIQIYRLDQTTECCGIFIVDIEDQHMRMGMFCKQPLQNAGHC